MTRVIQVSTPAPREEWRAIAAGDRRALPEHAPEWVDAICAAGRYADASRLYELSDGRSVVLPLVARRGVLGLGGWWQGYPPAWGIGGLVGDGVDAEAIAVVLADLRAAGRQRIALRPDPARWSAWHDALTLVDRRAAAARNFHPRAHSPGGSGSTDPQFPSMDGNCDSSSGGLTPTTDQQVRAGRRGAEILVIPRRAHVIDLTGGVDQAFGQLSKSARRGTRVAERAGVRVEIDRTGALLADYQRLHLLSVDRWADRQHEPRALARWRDHRRDPIRKLEAMAEHLGKEFVVTVAYVEDRPAFASITLLGQTAHDTRAAMDRDLVEGTYAGDLVQWRLIELACELGCTAYHLGESGQSVSLSQFKEKFGARPVDYAELRLERLPWTRVDQHARSAVKRLLRFRDV